MPQPPSTGPDSPRSEDETPRTRPLERFWPYAELSEEPTAEELAALDPDLHAALFFAFFFLTDPPTSPNRYRDQIICALIVAAAGYLIFERLGAAHYLLSGVLVGNVWEAGRRYVGSRLRAQGTT